MIHSSSLSIKTNKPPLKNLNSINIIEEFLNKNQSVNLKNIQSFLSTKLTFENTNLLLDAGLLDEELYERKRELSLIQINELTRLDKQFMFGNYQRHCDVSRKVLIAALVGNRKAGEEMSRVNRSMNKYLDKISACKIYYTLEGTSL